ncbi:hypothetical protein KAW38_03435 [Candidatus Micrarchaeota archaeon]|nr:hypothetical protein [Candidatus Micrarchaeota archaeon]
MGILDIVKQALGGKGKSTLADKYFKCPSCGYEKITLEMKRCPGCGVRIKSMFKKKCPKCGELNDLDAKRCKNKECGYDFEAEERRAKKRVWRCPICGYEATYYMTRCPVCGTRFG